MCFPGAMRWWWGLFLLLWSVVDGRVILGNEVLRDSGYKQLQGQRVGILTNPTGIFVDSMEHIVDAMHASPLVEVVAVFSPEHGFRGEKQAETGDPLFYVDEATGLPVFSAYNMSVTQLSTVLIEMNITMVVVDMQDVGVRLYTFIWTMYNMMEAAVPASATILVTDKPNPLGDIIDGPLLNTSCCVSGYGRYAIPHMHGMTIAELASLFSSSLHTSLITIPMLHYRRDMTWTATDLPWTPPSPNIPTPSSAVAYAASVFLEATTVSEGRGTTTPFEYFGAPFLNAQELSDALNIAFGADPKSRFFRANYYQPTFSKYNNTVVPGVQWYSERSATTSPFINGFLGASHILRTVIDLSPPDTFQWDGSWFGHPGTELIDDYAGTPLFREMLDAGWSAQRISAYFASDRVLFAEMRAAYLLYE